MRATASYLVVALILVCGGIYAQAAADSDEIALYNENGKPIAYIADDDDSTVYLWSGKPVAYLQSENIYGFNGKHLGWFVKGLIYNHDGETVGATRSRVKGPVQISPIKSIKQIRPIKSIREIKPIRPILGLTADSGRCRSAFRAHADHLIRAMSISDSGGCRSLIPG
jgi:hypothetical protein